MPLSIIFIILIRFHKELQERQRESAISQNICDIILKYVSYTPTSHHRHTYSNYCLI